MRRKALVVVDVQNDFCPGGSLAVPEGDKVVTPLNRLIEHAIYQGWLIFASRDWHPKITSHFAQYGGVWPVHCVQGTLGAQFHPDLRVSHAIIISKATEKDEDAYSAFDGRSFDGELLLEILRKAYVKEVYIGGLATDYCVKATALDALRHGFKTYLLLDACRGVDLNPGDSEKAIEEMAKEGVFLTTTEEVIRDHQYPS